jgi:hypothetical protein
MSDAEVDYEVVTNASQLDAPPPLLKELVVLPEWKTRNGKASAFWVWELTAAEHGEYAVSDRVFDENGQVIRFKRTGNDLRFLSYCVRDASGNRLWNTLEKAETELGKRGKSGINKLTAVANKLNYEGASSADEAVASAEGNSEETANAA